MWFRFTDLHVTVVGVMTSVVFGFVGSSFPRQGSFVANLSGFLVFLFLNPMILTRAIDKKRHPEDAWRYLIVNEIIALSFGILVASTLKVFASHLL